MVEKDRFSACALHVGIKENKIRCSWGEGKSTRTFCEPVNKKKKEGRERVTKGIREDTPNRYMFLQKRGICAKLLRVPEERKIGTRNVGRSAECQREGWKNWELTSRTRTCSSLGGSSAR